MSEFTYGNLILNSNKSVVRNYCPNGTAILPLNEQWTAFFTEGDSETTSSSYIKAFSNDCPVLYFYNLEDHCWGYHIWSAGELSSHLHFSYEFESELLFSVAQERYPEQEYIASFLFDDDEGQKVFKEIQKELSDDSAFEEALKKHFRSVKAEDFKLFGFEEDIVKQLAELLTVDTYFCSEEEHEIVKEFKKLINIKDMSWFRFERIEREDEEFDFI